jgi:hypothetical protein
VRDVCSKRDKGEIREMVRPAIKDLRSNQRVSCSLSHESILEIGVASSVLPSISFLWKEQIPESLSSSF